MGALIEELKRRLKVEDVIGARCGGLVREGAGYHTSQHDSLKIDPDRQIWTWFSRELGGKPASGDVIAFLAFERYSRTKFSQLDQEEKKTVLQEACQLAGMDWEQARKEYRKDKQPNQPRPDGAPVTVKPPATRKKGRWFSTAVEAEECLAGGLARDGYKLARSWTYEARTKKGNFEPAIKVLRFERTVESRVEKELRPLHRVKNGWRVGLGPWGGKRWNAETKKTEIARLCPVYNLAKIELALKMGHNYQPGEPLKFTPLSAANVLHVVEGEKCADALERFLFLATTSQGGCGRQAETDWSPVRRWLTAGGKVLLWPDQDAWRAHCPKCGKETHVRHGKKRYEACGKCAYVWTLAEWEALNQGASNSGLGYMDSIADQVAAGASPFEQERLCMVDLSSAGLSEGGDVADLVAGGQAAGKADATLKGSIEELVQRAGLWKRSTPSISALAPATAVQGPDPASQAWLDKDLGVKLSEIVGLSGLKRDEVAVVLFSRIAEALAGTEPVTKDRIKELVCKRLEVGKRAYDQQLKSARARAAAQHGISAADEFDWAGLAERYLGALRQGEWVAG